MKSRYPLRALLWLGLTTGITACSVEDPEASKTNTSGSPAATATQTPVISDMTLAKLADALRWELNHYGPVSSSDNIDYQVVGIRDVSQRQINTGIEYLITVVFDTGSVSDSADRVTYWSRIIEDHSGYLSIAEYHTL